MLPTKLTFVDLETTGSSTYADRIIEIGILRVENNKLVKKYHTLVDPQSHVSPYILDMTGINIRDLDKAPTFREIKDDIAELLDDAVFVAHNVRFDYGFLRGEFRRHQTQFSAKHFCTVKLFRALYPQLAHHNLDTLISHMGFKCANRHRAFDDAQVLWQFYKKIQKQFPLETIAQSINFALKKPSLPIGLPAETLDSLPEGPGVYTFYDEQGLALYIGKSINIRDRVLSHFAADQVSSTEMKISQQIKSIETTTTDTELEALILESNLIKKMSPVYNRKLRSRRDLVLTTRVTNTAGYEGIKMGTLEDLDLENMQDVMGVYRSLKQAKDTLQRICAQHELCPKASGIEKGSGACFAYHLGKCKGACIGKEKPLLHNLRFTEAFSRQKLAVWPFKGPIIIQGKFIVDKWCIVNEDEDYTFDIDTYRILHSFIQDIKNHKYIKNVATSSVPNVSLREVFPF